MEQPDLDLTALVEPGSLFHLNLKRCSDSLARPATVRGPRKE
jgi:hypothetical protein